jgi:hypothetical protein
MGLVTYLLEYVYCNMCLVLKFVICRRTTGWCYVLVSLSNLNSAMSHEVYYCNLILTECYRSLSYKRKDLGHCF